MIIALYACCVGLTLAYLLWRCRDFRMIYFALSVVLVLMLVYLPIGDQRTLVMAVLLLVTVLVPVSRLLWRDLRDVASQLGHVRLLGLAGRSILLWLPVALLGAASVALVSWRDDAVRDGIYSIDANSEWAGPCRYLVCDEHDGQQDMRRDLHITTQRLADRMRTKIGEELGPVMAKVNADAGDAGAALLDELFDKRSGALFPPDFETFAGISIPGCAWPLAVVWPPEMVNCLKRTVLQPVAAAYADIRGDLKRDLSGRIAQLSADLSEGTDQVQQELLGFIERELDDRVKAAQAGIDWAFLIGWILITLSWLTLVMVMTKTYLVILARFVFDARTGGVPLSLSGQRRSTPALAGRDITRSDGAFGYRVPLEGQAWFGSFGRNVRPDEHGRPCFPMLGRLFLRRAFSGKLRMQRFDPARFEHIGGQADHSTRFVRVDLTAQDQLCFAMPNLVAFSAGISLDSVLNLKLAAMLQHRLFFSVARGPGSVILRVDGGTMRLMPRDEPEGADPMDMAAFDIDGSFVLRAQHDYLSVYSEGYTVLPDAHTFAIRHAPDRMSWRGGKILRKAMFFLLPI